MIVVLRLNHRISRDKRISTHAGLVARAFGADKIIYTGEEDNRLYDSLRKVVQEWGGSFKINYFPDYDEVIKKYKDFTIIHLTMYGMPVQEKIEAIKKSTDLLLIIGGEKVPPDIYEKSDYNISITNQPHSEIAALAVMLDYYHEGSELDKEYPNASKRIKPSERGKEFL